MPKKKSGKINEGLHNRLPCFLCGTWALEKHLKPVLLSNTQELICSTCYIKFEEGDRRREMDAIQQKKINRETASDSEPGSNNYILD